MYNNQNLLYVLFFYPLHTRFIQVWIHIEAIKIFFKGVPTFDHPQGTDVNFGFGITDKVILKGINSVTSPIYGLIDIINTVLIHNFGTAVLRPNIKKD